MKTLRLLLTLALAAIAPLALAQSDAKASFDKVKTLTGVWRGQVKTNPPHPEWENAPIWVTMRTTSRGNALVHEIKQPGTPDDLTKDDPVTMFYVDGDHLTLTHYCDAGNRPRMTARGSSDGKTIEFDLADVAGNMEYGHMHHAVFTFIDADHHTEDWTFMMPGDKPIVAHLDLQRSK